MTADQKSFVKPIAKYVQKYAPKYGIRVCSPIIAQAILESGWGASKLARYYNYFGMKCGTKWTGKSVSMLTQEEYLPGQLSTIRDNFRAYDSMEEGVKGYFEFLQMPRYQNLRGITDPKEYLQTLKDDGYATDSQYVSKLMKVITENNLTAYDNKAEKKEVKKMSIMLSNCSSSETGGINGKKGDQTGGEYKIRSYYVYSKGWNVMLRHPDARVQAKLSEVARAAAKNDHIGYGQSDRLSYYEALKKAGWDPSKIKVDCNADCSSSTAANVIAVGYLLGIPELQKLSPDCWTGNLQAALVAVGFVAYTSSKYLTSANYLHAGDILLNTLHHVTIVVTSSDAVSSATTASTTAKTTKINPICGTCSVTLKQFLQGAIDPQVTVIQMQLNRLGYRGKDGEKLIQDGELGENTVFALSAFQKANGMKNINFGSVAKKTWELILNAK